MVAVKGRREQLRADLEKPNDSGKLLPWLSGRGLPTTLNKSVKEASGSNEASLFITLTGKRMYEREKGGRGDGNDRKRSKLNSKKFSIYSKLFSIGRLRDSSEISRRLVGSIKTRKEDGEKDEILTLAAGLLSNSRKMTRKTEETKTRHAEGAENCEQ